MFSVLIGYESLQARKDTRETAWTKPGWDQCVAYTGKYGANQSLAVETTCM